MRLIGGTSHFTSPSLKERGLEGEASQLLIHQQSLGCCVLNGEWFEGFHTDDEEIGIAIECMVVAHIHEGWIEYLRTIAVMTVVGEVAHNH